MRVRMGVVHLVAEASPKDLHVRAASVTDPRELSDEALAAVIQEAYVQGISTRSVDELVKALGMAGISKSQVSRLCAEIDERVRTFLERPIEGLPGLVGERGPNPAPTGGPALDMAGFLWLENDPEDGGGAWGAWPDRGAAGLPMNSSARSATWKDGSRIGQGCTERRTLRQGRPP